MALSPCSCDSFKFQVPDYKESNAVKIRISTTGEKLREPVTILVKEFPRKKAEDVILDGLLS